MSDALPPEHRQLLRQRGISRLLSPIWIPLFTGIMLLAMRWRLEDPEAARAEYARLRADGAGPILICANHLTMLDSFVIGWALGGVRFYLRDFGALAWNTPERVNFASTFWKRGLAYLLKCVPVTRGSDRKEVAEVLGKVGFLLSRNEAVLIFPEGGRSRTGRVDSENAAYGVGRLVSSVPGCRVLCVYLRGQSQESWSDAPARGEVFDVSVSCIEPKSDQRGLRGSLDIARQIVLRLTELEQAYFDDRK